MWPHTWDADSWLAMASMMTLMSLLTAAAVVRSQRRESHGAACRVLDDRYAPGELDRRRVRRTAPRAHRALRHHGGGRS